jgi:hypothetical protein
MDNEVKNYNEDMSLIAGTIAELRSMVEQSVLYQTEVSPIYTSISKKVLEILNNDEELQNWAPKDLLKLFEVTNKAQLQPVETLAKLVQSITALYERTALQDKMDNLQSVVEELESRGKADQVKPDELDYASIEDVELIKQS